MVGWVVIALVLGLCIFLLYLLFSGPSQKDDSSSSVVIIDYVPDSSQNDSSKPDDTSSQSDSSDDGLGEGAIMPNMVGVRIDVVKQQIANNFDLKIEYFFSDEDERNIVYEQSIPEGTSYDPAKKNELVLKVCSGPENVKVPNYYGLDQKSYLDQLNELNIKYKVSEVYGSQRAGSILGTSIVPGNKINVKKGDVLVVYVSDGKNTTAATTTKESDTEVVTKKTNETQAQTKPTQPTQAQTKAQEQPQNNQQQ